MPSLNSSTSKKGLDKTNYYDKTGVKVVNVETITITYRRPRKGSDQLFVTLSINPYVHRQLSRTFLWYFPKTIIGPGDGHYSWVQDVHTSVMM